MVLSELSHVAEHALHLPLQRRRRSHPPRLAAFVVQQESVQLLLRGEEHQHRVFLRQRFLHLGQAAQRRKDHVGRLAPQGNLAQNHLLLRADGGQVAQLVHLLLAGLLVFGHQRQLVQRLADRLRLSRKPLVFRVSGKHVLPLQDRLLRQLRDRGFENPSQRFEPAAELERIEEPPPPRALGDVDRRLHLSNALPFHGRLEPVIHRRRLRSGERGQRFHRIEAPVGRLRIAEHLAEEIEGRPRRDVAVGVEVIGQTDLEEPERAAAHVVHRGREGLVAFGNLLLLIRHQRGEIMETCADQAGAHLAVADGETSVVEHGRGLAGFAQHGVVLGGAEEQRSPQLPRGPRFRPENGGLQRRIEPFAVGHQVRDRAVAERLFENAVIGE